MFHKVLVAIDVDDQNGWERLLEQALACIDRADGLIRLVHVRSDLPQSWQDYIPPDFDHAEQDRCEKRLVEVIKMIAHPVELISSVVRMGGVHNETLHEADAWQADLIVVGPHRSKGIPGLLLGSSASTVVRHATMPVLVVR